MPEIPVLMPVAAGPMTAIFSPLFELMKSPNARISLCSEINGEVLSLKAPVLNSLSFRT